jgi:DNA-binding transcriptional LysR family regulator
VADNASISRAAQSLHLTQGAVTQQLHNFEKALGLTLVERSSRGVKLTAAGQTLANSCKGAVRGFEVIAETARSLKQLHAGSLRVGASPTAATFYVPGLLARFTGSFPGVSLDVTVEPSAVISDLVRSGVIECALVEGRYDPSLTAVLIAWDELVLVVAPTHPLARAPKVSPADLARQRYLARGRMWAAESQVRDMIGIAFEESDVMNLGHPEYVRAAALAGLGYAALPLLAVKGDLETGALVRLPGVTKKRPITAIRRKPAGAPTLEEFWRVVVAGAARAAAR